MPFLVDGLWSIVDSLWLTINHQPSTIDIYFYYV